MQPKAEAMDEESQTNETIHVAKQTTEEHNIVDWEGPDDPNEPLNWSPLRKNVNIGLVSLFTLVANLAATMFAPGVLDLSREFHVTDSTLQSMTVSLYVLGFAVGPLALAPLSEIYGRLVIYHFYNIAYLAFTAGCAFSTNVDMFIAFRFICGCAASAPMSIGGGTVADLMPVEKRGKAMALFAMGPIIGPVIGPIIGGFVSQYIGWRWTFRIIMIMTGVLGIASAFLLEETSATVLLQRKAEQLRKETGNDKLLSKYHVTEGPWAVLRYGIVRPFKLLILSPIVLVVSLYTGVMFGLIFLLFATFPAVFSGTYHFSASTAGLAYLGLGIGMFLGLVMFSVFSDKLLNKKTDGETTAPEQRLILMKWLGPITPLGLFIYGWTAYYETHWIFPILGTFVVGLGSLFIVLPGQIYLVDCFGAEAAASAMAANLLVRSPFGAFFGLCAPPLYSKLDLGWGNSVLGFITLAFTPVPWLMNRYGESLRARFTVKL